MTRRRVRFLLAWALVLLGIGALGAHRGEFHRMDAWGWVAIVALATAPFVGIRQRPPLRWPLASLPFWAFGNVSEWMLLTGVGLTIAGLARAAVVPTLVGRRVWRFTRTPLEHLASGPVVPVEPREFTGGRRSRGLAYSSAIFFLLAAVLAIFGVLRSAYDLIALAIPSVIIAATFAFGNWFAARVRVRVDEVGVHGRMMFVEHTVKWTDVSGLRLRYLFLPGYGIRLIYYVVESAHHEVAFPSSMGGAKALQACIEAATGLRWPEPEITATM